MAEKVRVHHLAKELGVPSKVILEKCRAEGLENQVKNHMSTLSAGLDATIREWFSEGSHETTVETATRVDLTRVRKRRRKKAEAANADAGGEDQSTAVAVAEQPEGDTQVAPPQETTAPTVEAPADLATRVEEAAEADAAEAAPESDEPTDAQTAEAAPQEPAAARAAAQIESPEADEAVAEEEVREPFKPAGPQNVPKPAVMRGPRVVRYESPEVDYRPPRPSMRRTSSYDAAQPAAQPPAKGPAKRGKAVARRPGRDTAGRGEWRDRDLAERRERVSQATGRRIRRRTSGDGGGAGVVDTRPRGKVTLHEPISMKEFCAATGENFLEVMRVLKREHHIDGNINMSLSNELAELLALHFEIEVEIVPARTKLDQLKDEVQARERKNRVSRAPVVTILGHVDHGKTSLLDRIRTTKVAAGEDGGITQHIGASLIETKQGNVVFLDTPGHAAFTAMRARGAQMTDIVVLVVAADDGVMPQTVEAINHAKDANVPIIVALTKIDLGDHNKMKIYGQLSEHGLTPSGDWGGDVDVIPTSVVTGHGVDNLLDHIVATGEILELRADPDVPAVGTVIEAQTREGVGPVVSLLVEEGTLSVGDVVVCGNAAGKVRAIVDDKGSRINNAGPATPVEVWGIDDVPEAGDKLYQIDTLPNAKVISHEIKQTRLESSRQQSQKVQSLEEMFRQVDAAEIPILNIIIKADTDGSVTALKQSLVKIPSDEVKLSVRHAAVGVVNDSDVLLAATTNGIIIAYRVDSSPSAKRLSEQHGVEIRDYRVIYDVTDDIKKALEGLLAPEEKEESRGRVEVRNVFNISKVGTVAGSYVTEGTVDRNHKVRLLRDGAVVREGMALASLKRFKDDVKTVRAGMECGIRLQGYDDVHVGDVIETYEIKKIARTL